MLLNRAVTKQYMITIGTCTGVTARIEKAQMDGSNRVVLHSVQLVWPNALAIDLISQHLC